MNLQHMQQPGLSAAIRGIIWMTLACVFYALIYVVVRGLSDSYATTQIVFFRAVLGSVLMLPWLYRAGLQGLKTSRMGIYMWRMGFSYAGALGWMYGIAFLPLSEANALLFTMPLFTVAFAAIWLRERVGSHRWSATAAGFLGVLIILRPGLIEISLPALATLMAAASFSVALIGTKKLTATEDPNAMVFYLYTLMIPPAALGSLWGWSNPALADIPLLVALGLCTVGAQQCQTRSFCLAPASLVVIVNYVQLPMVALMGWLFFRQSTDPWTWAGAAVICASTYYISYRENRATGPRAER